MCPLCRAKEPPQLPLTPQLERRGRRRARALSEKVEWVECEGPCAQWFHLICLSVKPMGDEKWLCQPCVDAQSNEEQDELGDHE